MINYKLISDSIEYYEKEGFKRMEVPWTVSESIARVTMPSNVDPIRLHHSDGKVLIGSAEQGFLYLLSKGFLVPGAYQAVSPCFRSDVHDEIHSKFFMKNELILTGDKISSKDVRNVMDYAFEFLSKNSNQPLKISEIENDSYDIVTVDGIEVGSYGYRECASIKWIYGTGLAEPRFSRICGG